MEYEVSLQTISWINSLRNSKALDLNPCCFLCNVLI